MHAVPPAPDRPHVGVCTEHHAAMDGAVWVHRQGAILLGDDLPALFQADRVTM